MNGTGGADPDPEVGIEVDQMTRDTRFDVEVVVRNELADIVEYERTLHPSAIIVLREKRGPSHSAFRTASSQSSSLVLADALLCFLNELEGLGVMQHVGLGDLRVGAFFDVEENAAFSLCVPVEVTSQLVKNNLALQIEVYPVVAEHEEGACLQ